MSTFQNAEFSLMQAGTQPNQPYTNNKVSVTRA